MILCHCVGATDEMIRQLIRDGAESVADIARRSGAGQCCAPCREEIARVLASAIRERRVLATPDLAAS